MHLNAVLDYVLLYDPIGELTYVSMSFIEWKSFQFSKIVVKWFIVLILF